MTSNPEQPSVLVEREGPIGWIVLNRPERLNAMNAEMLELFDQATEELKLDDAVRVIIIRGAGRAFSAGYDIERKPDGPPRHSGPIADFARLSKNVDRFLKLWDCPKPVIAAVHGYCLAGATQLALFCDLTVVAEDAVIGMPKIPVGGGFITPMWTWLIGPKRAKQMAFSAGRSISGTEAVEWGLANYAVPAESLLDNVRALATDFARTPAGIIAMKKYAINRVMDLQGFRSIVGLGAETDALLHASEEVETLSAGIREHGLKEAIQRFERGEFG